MGLASGKRKIFGAFVTLGSVSAIFVTPFLNRVVDDWYGPGKDGGMEEEDIVEKTGDPGIIRTPDPKKTHIHETFKRIKKWSRPLGCSLEFSISSVDGIYLKLNILHLLLNGDSEIFRPQEKLMGKNKFERLADQLESDDPVISKYVEKVLARRCLRNDLITLHWRDRIKDWEKMNSKYRSMELVWVDEKSLGVRRIPD